MQYCLFGLAIIADSLAGQTEGAPWIAGLLPAKAKVIEISEVKSGTRSVDRGLVLWMVDPVRVLRANPGIRVAGHSSGGCSDRIYGDHWYGRANVSLVDLRRRRIINTVAIKGMYEGAADGGFPIPFRVADGAYHVPIVDVENEGVPRILYLQDLTGEGSLGQFVLFEYEACELYLTTVLGYSPKLDRAVQFGVEILTTEGQWKVVPWVERVFGVKPLQPGVWDFSWEPGHGFEGFIRERVTFDRRRQVFTKKQQ